MDERDAELSRLREETRRGHRGSPGEKYTFFALKKVKYKVLDA